MTCTRGCCPTQREHYRSIAFGAAATPGRRPEAVSITERDARWAKDMDAYKRLRGNGLQPRGIDGSARLEAGADHAQEIKMGQFLPPKAIKEALTIQSDHGTA